ncbi:MAG: hypothetical protein AUG49_24895 [Catenulispora sp. 13_1_20CM_3_70_7]|nr:MAG: hypothetical protein AUG49_24895 [Catenulispora sp. 13_1_20CM_3_70_7]
MPSERTPDVTLGATVTVTGAATGFAELFDVPPTPRIPNPTPAPTASADVNHALTNSTLRGR